MYLILFFVDGEDVSDIVVDGIDVQDFGLPDSQVEHPYPEFQNESTYFLPI